MLALVVLGLFAPSQAAATHLTTDPTAAPTIPWGFNEAWGFHAGVWSPKTTVRHLKLAEQIIPPTLSANRFHVEWSKVETRKGHYSWKRTDRIFSLMREHGDRPVLMIYNAPEWARRPHSRCPSDDACAFPPRRRFDHAWGKFVEAAVRRYRGVRALEVWNEPNLGRFWAPRPKVSRYVDLLDAASKAVAEAGSPVPVVTGGVTASSNNSINISSAEFLRRLYIQGDVRDFDGIGSHPYPWRPPYVEQFTKWLDKVRAVRDSNGDTRTPIWITEIGISSDPLSGSSLEDQLQIVDLYRSALGHDVAAFIIHRLQDINYEGYFWSQTGVVTQELEPKPAYCSLASGIGTGATCGEPAADQP